MLPLPLPPLGLLIPSIASTLRVPASGVKPPPSTGVGATLAPPAPLRAVDSPDRGSSPREPPVPSLPLPVVSDVTVTTQRQHEENSAANSEYFADEKFQLL
jgi:hypothetical protein